MKPISFFISILLISSNLVFGQKQEDMSLEYYKKGTRMLEQEKYKEADSLLTLSAFLNPHRDTFYNLALAKFHLGDKCGYCENMKFAQNSGDLEAGRLYNSYCTKKDSINYNNEAHTDSVFYSIIVTHICTHKKLQIFNIKNIQKGELTSFYITGKDTVAVQEGKYLSEFPDLKKLSPDQIGYTGITTMPSYDGGDKARVLFLTAQIQYPQEALDNGIQGTVFLKFIVEADGSITDVRILRGIGGGCDEEAVRVVKLMPKWNPGKIGNTPVRVEFNMPIRFTIN